MRGLWLQDQKLEYRTDMPTPLPGNGEALIHVSLAGVCSTDLELLRGYYPFSGIPGHEFVGEVVSSPAEPSWTGKRVVGEINIACGLCTMCLTGLPRHCEQRKTLGIHDWNGVFAEYLVLPLVNLHEVPAQIPDESAVFTEPIAAACEILEQVELNNKERVLIIGAGRLGQLVAQVLQATGCSIEVVARHPRQTQLLADRKIRTIAEQDLPNNKYDLVVEATGTSDGFLSARRFVRPLGTIILKSTYKGITPVNFSSIVVDEVNLLGSRCGPFKPALHLLESGQVDPKPLIDAVYPLEQGLIAFEHAGRPGALKILSRLG
ncbi:MAG TPA: alcohol dehydrogenase catalytic domain-containing protein [Anaerolineales bacterium]|nr:alcohol dehydrogenase catalytic domain-containing protein [Anaerolineales bacterium]